MRGARWQMCRSLLPAIAADLLPIVAPLTGCGFKCSLLKVGLPACMCRQAYFAKGSRRTLRPVIRYQVSQTTARWRPWNTLRKSVSARAAPQDVRCGHQIFRPTFWVTSYDTPRCSCAGEWHRRLQAQSLCRICRLCVLPIFPVK